MKFYLIIFCLMSFSVFSLFANEAELVMRKGERLIFRVNDLGSHEHGDVIELFQGKKSQGEIEILKINKTRTKILANAVGDASVFEEGSVLEFDKAPEVKIEKKLAPKHFGHVYILDNTNKNYTYLLNGKDGASAAGTWNIVQTSFGIGYEHMWNIMDDLFHAGGGATYEFGKDVSFVDINFSDNDNLGGTANVKIKSVLTFYGNLSLNVQDIFDLYFGFNYSSMATSETTHSSLGYQAGIAAMKKHIRFGAMYRLNVYEGDVSIGKETILANDIIGTIGWVF